MKIVSSKVWYQAIYKACVVTLDFIYSRQQDFRTVRNLPNMLFSYITLKDSGGVQTILWTLSFFIYFLTAFIPEKYTFLIVSC